MCVRSLGICGVEEISQNEVDYSKHTHRTKWMRDRERERDRALKLFLIGSFRICVIGLCGLFPVAKTKHINLICLRMIVMAGRFSLFG